MPNQFTFKCSICRAAPEVARHIEREILTLHHEYRRVAKATGFSRSTIWRHCNVCQDRKVAAEHSNLRCPDYIQRIDALWPDGHVDSQPCHVPRHVKNPLSLPIVELEIVFEDAKPARILSTVRNTQATEPVDATTVPDSPVG